MIYNENEKEYQVKFYQNSQSSKSAVFDYVENLDLKAKAKVLKYIEFLRQHQGYLDEPYSRHIKGKIRELWVDFGRQRHRIFYVMFIKKTIILLYAFLKKTDKTPIAEIKKAENNYFDAINNQKLYE
ncbi:type II toxin-antitoxin system RelE/ParE family toxin [Candidatus Kuenenbacteria bacterium CG08_land_8_20_14_0_20_37_23]|uniref:Type II toxin-antitoxin system RelE/ParE family toxin n=1 Tax=Candidatus Kuenenbacteria bacterium CG08_land_8_20_14_0_20_37_23 TaxID=1974617 RepID=A0A2M6XRW0_9BACT|nr:MAG: type II toxin-antitoxin system RelE/ParE family toxin [Candidatus Kuenenbacteria bacterium CG08_land_8_20_14_0_20_37_23]